jgi:excisionase family DNA binding protein
MSEEWITTATAAELSGYHPEYIRRLIRRGEISGRKFGIVWQVNKSSIVSYVKAARNSKDRRKGPKK